MITTSNIDIITGKRTKLSERERSDYLKMIVNDIPQADIDWLIGTLLYSRAKEKREQTSITFKICDFCSLTYPYNTLNCDKCRSDRLRDFQIEHNYEAILDGIKKKRY